MISTVGTRRTERPSGFTIVELMIVIAIIAVLASSVVVVARGMRKRALESATKAELAKIQVLVEKYKDNNGRYPNATRRVGMYHVNVWNSMTAEQRLFVMLFEASDQYRQQEIREDFVYDSDDDALEEDGTKSAVEEDNVAVPVLIDPYGNQIAFRCAAKSYFMYSLGPDGVTAETDMLDNDGDGTADPADTDEDKLNGKVGDDILL